MNDWVLKDYSYFVSDIGNYSYSRQNSDGFKRNLVPKTGFFYKEKDKGTFFIFIEEVKCLGTNSILKFKNTSTNVELFMTEDYFSDHFDEVDHKDIFKK